MHIWAGFSGAMITSDVRDQMFQRNQAGIPITALKEKFERPSRAKAFVSAKNNVSFQKTLRMCHLFLLISTFSLPVGIIFFAICGVLEKQRNLANLFNSRLELLSGDLLGPILQHHVGRSV